MEKQSVEPAANAALKKEEWVAALRSGSFEQTRGQWANKTCNPTAFCCIGVAGQINGFDYSEYENVRRALGMADDIQDALIDMNDKERLSFAEIADWVETHDLETGEPLTSRTEGPAPTPLSE